jgi:DNA-binding CsgD family transcriptional regulator
MRTWLVKGTRRFAVDPRRRFGRHGGARRLLSTDGEVPATPHGAWGGLVSALQRHTVHGELAQLSREDRQILSLAYLSGHTNREIAAMLNVSVSTVRRRLSIALARLEESMRRAGVWVGAILLGAAALYGRAAHSARGTRWPSTVAMVAAGTVTAVTIGMVAVGPPAAQAGAQSRQSLATRPPVILPHAGGPLAGLSTTTTTLDDTIGPSNPRGRLQAGANHTATQSDAQTLGCHGNPTDAPPPVPVGTRGPDPGAPVTHPGRGGCGPHAS